jgi:hypothetical protein
MATPALGDGAQLFVIDPIARLNPSKDSSVALMQAAERAGRPVWAECTNRNMRTQVMLTRRPPRTNGCLTAPVQFSHGQCPPRRSSVSAADAPPDSDAADGSVGWQSPAG